MTEQGDELAGWPLWKVRVLAFVAMYLNDAILTAMVVFESGYKGWQAGLADDLGWYAGLVCSVISVGGILRRGWKSKWSLSVIGAVSFANFLGTVTGVAITAAINHHHG